eukprot:TRINITY_DN10671_c0_g1_i1.p1 TRINITY_DN10671_c0_g1~~TRINITY_DN10671_c0_g1_i1.p1  ORF type:complete len:374 (-),score=62.87 TRINITY_DN10671_c0_g1_i1:173-1294(-)
MPTIVCFDCPVPPERPSELHADPVSLIAGSAVDVLSQNAENVLAVLSSMNLRDLTTGDISTCVSAVQAQANDSSLTTHVLFATTRAPTDLPLPVHVKLHVLALNSRALDWTAALRNVFVGALTEDSATLVHRVLDVHYKPYVGALQVGTMHTDIKLYPDPCVFSCHLFASLSQLPLVMPRQLDIVGFVPIGWLSGAPALSRHYVRSVFVHTPALLSTLCRAVLRESVAAVIRLGPQWFALLYVPIEQEENIEMVLSTLLPEIAVPWLTSLNSIRTLDAKPLQPSYLGASSKDAAQLLSYHPEIVAADLPKILRYATALPGKKDLLQAECDKIISVARMYNFPAYALSVAEALRALPESDALQAMIVYLESAMA